MKNPLILRMAEKIKNYLSSKEGCNVPTENHTSESTRLYIQDAFGYRYEVEIKLVGRIDSGNFDTNDRYAKIAFLGVGHG